MILISLNLHGQDQIDFFLARFQADAIGENVIIRYTIRSGAICNDLVIERSVNNEEFTEVYRHFGLCGFTDREAHYHFIDKDAPSGLINYRIVIYGNIVSEPISLKFIRLSGEKALVAPNPFDRYTTIYFPNATNEWFDYEIFDNQGKTVQMGKTKTGEINIDFSDCRTGHYYYRVFSSRFVYQGRISKN
ncbi:MAG: T9SS type A sorting domain-containing protein [Flavobacteriales bacterium]